MKSTNDSGFPTFRLGRDLKAATEKGQTILLALTVLMGFLLPRSTIYGNVSPFAVGLVAAAVGTQSIPVFISAFIGYLVSGNAYVLRYLAALVTVVGIRWSISGFPKIFRSVYYAPTVTFISTLITGSAMFLTQKRTLTEVVYLFSECLLAAGFSYFCSQFFAETRPRKKERAYELRLGTICVCCVAIMSLFTVQWQDISLGRIVAALCILVCADCSGIKGGCIVGCLLGATAFLSDPAQINLIPIYTFGGLLSGFFSSKKRWLSLVSLFTVNIIVFSVINPEIDYSFVVSMYEIAAAGVFRLLIPTSFEQHIRSVFVERSNLIGSQRTREAVALKMKKAAQTMSDVAGTMDVISNRLSGDGKPTISAIYKKVADHTCNQCKRRLNCWESHYSEIMDSYNHITPQLTQNGHITVEHLSGFLKDHCPFPKQICDEVNTAYREYLVQEEAFRRLYHLRAAINDQFETIGKMLFEFSKSFETPQWNDAQTSQKIESDLIRKHYAATEANCRIESDGHMEVELLIASVCSPTDVEDICRSVEHCCSRTFSNPTVEHEKNSTRICLSEGQVYRAIISTAQLRCKGEQLCGDAVELFRDNNGNQFIVLSDGMGTGGRAAVDGAMTAGITAQLLRAGFGYESILHIVNTALMSKSDDETLATLDVACINLFTGELELLKAGAGPSLLLSKEHVSHIDQSSLPLGILRELTFARTRDRLTSGDVLVLMSDGISNDGLRWVEDLLRAFDPQNGNLQLLSHTIVETARKLQHDGRGDDMTVIAVKLEKINDPNRIS